jgi:nickel transport protein
LTVPEFEFLCCRLTGGSGSSRSFAPAGSFTSQERRTMSQNFLKCLIATSLLGCFFLAAPAYAHKVNIFAYVENGKIFTESYFPDGKKIEGGTIQVFDSQNQKVAEGKTDKEGKFSLPIPKKDDLTIVIDASMGHKNTFLLKKSELGE